HKFANIHFEQFIIIWLRFLKLSSQEFYSALRSVEIIILVMAGKNNQAVPSTSASTPGGAPGPSTSKAV
ncbi:hypothetical protein X975_22399, partial [Stegodyphus mimosarum]